MARVGVAPMVVCMIVPMTVIAVVVIMVVVSDTIRRLAHMVKLATAGGHGHAAFYCRGVGAAGS
jgi:hypothetical protein